MFDEQLMLRMLINIVHFGVTQLITHIMKQVQQYRISIHLVSCENSRKEKFYFNFFITDAKNKDMVVVKRCIINNTGEFRIR
jgi:hypothetical protein